MFCEYWEQTRIGLAEMANVWQQKALNQGAEIWRQFLAERIVWLAIR